MDEPLPEVEFRRTVRLRTRWVDGDVQGVLNNAVYLTLMEEARLAYFEELGLMAEGRFPFVLARADVRFLAPGMGGRDVLVDIATVRLGTTSFEQVYRVRDARDGTVWCAASARLVGWDEERRAKRELSAEFRRAIARAEGTVG